MSCSEKPGAEEEGEGGEGSATWCWETETGGQETCGCVLCLTGGLLALCVRHGSLGDYSGQPCYCPSGAFFSF